MARLGIIAAIQPSFPGVIWYDEDIHNLVDEEGPGNMFRWPEYVEAGVIAAASPYNPDPRHPELTGGSHVSPMGLLYRSVTQVGLGESTPEPWMLDRALPVETLLPMMTIGGAYASNVDGDRGSLAAGKLADLVVLDRDPLTTPADELLDISVLMTMVGGVAEYVRPGAGDLAPPGPATLTPTPAVTPGPTVADAVDVARSASVSASSSLPTNPATNAVDGTADHWNAADLSPQWIELALEQPIELVAVRLDVAQDPPGPSVHEVWIRRVGSDLERVATFEGVTWDGDILTWAPADPVADVDLVRIVTTGLGDLFPAWREIEILRRPG